MYKKIICVFIFHIFEITGGSDVLGCGGFIKSHVNIDFSKVVVKLLTKQGILKDQTNCAPNGYYFIPLYDKGDYILELEPPVGWSFHPYNVHLAIDGKTDLCSKGNDINFVFKGFGITGKITSLGTNSGPCGATIELKSSTEVRSTVTNNGNFFFTPVFPGHYTITASHPRWKFLKNILHVVVTEGNTELPSNSFIIKGFDVNGSIKTDTNTLCGIIILLYSENEHSLVVDDCNKGLVDGLKTRDKLICYVTTDCKGNFVFPSVPNGRYYIAPYFNNKKLHFAPKQKHFTVSDDSTYLNEAFEIVGFSISGRVLSKANGLALKNVRITCNNEFVAHTNSEGIYMLDRIRSDTYTVQAESPDYLFEQLKDIRLDLGITQIPDIVPYAYRVCGTIVDDKKESVIVVATKMENGKPTSEFRLRTDSIDGQYCEYLSPGIYKLQVEVSETDKLQGIQFYPLVRTLEVKSTPETDVSFSQLKATVNGKVDCLKHDDCQGIKVVMRPSPTFSGFETSSKDSVPIAELRDGIFTFSDVRPGSYEVTLTSNHLCWKRPQYNITVSASTLTVPNFIQTGYSVVFVSSHDTQVNYNLKSTSKGISTSKESVNIPHGVSTYCLNTSGIYMFEIISCHIYPTTTFEYDTSSTSIDNEISLNAKKHRIIVGLNSNIDHGDILVQITIAGVKTMSKPLKYNQHNGYNLHIYLSAEETAVLVPQSDTLYFNPPIVSINGESDCVDLGDLFAAYKGRVFTGRIVPALKGVQITVESDDKVDLLVRESDSEGIYRFPPLDNTKSYKIYAKKDSYDLIGPDEHGNFLAHKLAEIIVNVVEGENNTPLQGALISLSGGENFRSNLQTNEEGKIIFPSLSQGEYFLKPMMKEYNFEPSTNSINVTVGATVKVLFRGKRFAYSVFGEIVSLNNQPEAKMTAMAKGLANCSHYSEESSSNTEGRFRIRGLIPFCTYAIEVQGSLEESNLIERAIPSSIHIPTVTEDMADMKFIVFRSPPSVEVLVRVYTENPDTYKNLRLKVSRESAPTSLLHTIRVQTIDNGHKISKEYNNGIMIHIPSIPMDGKTYSVILESTTDPSTSFGPSLALAKISKSHVKVLNADANFKYLELDYMTKTNIVDQHIKQTSIWALMFIFILVLAVYNIEKIVIVVKPYMPAINLDKFIKRKQAQDNYMDNKDIDQIVESINATKRRKSKKYS